mgnify:CR=1 FL=1
MTRQIPFDNLITCILNASIPAQMSLFQNRYRIPSARAPWWDYGWDAAYFVTICTKHRQHFFGRIVETRFIASPANTTEAFTPRKTMALSPTGHIAHQRWQDIPQHFPFARTDAFVAMPNHVHGIIIIRQEQSGTIETSAPTETDRKEGGITGKHNPMLHQNLSRVIRWYKGRITFEARKTQPDFAWQNRFHDHIIRDQQAYQHIVRYILTNPDRWDEDRFSDHEGI